MFGRVPNNAAPPLPRNAKHWVNNNQETNRHGVTEIVDDRTRFEMYYPPFAGAVEAGVGSVMCSYNKINADASQRPGDNGAQQHLAIQKGTRVLISLPGTRPNTSESHSEMSTRVPFCIVLQARGRVRTR